MGELLLLSWVSMESALFKHRNFTKRTQKNEAMPARALLAQGRVLCIAGTKRGGNHSSAAVRLSPQDCRHVAAFPSCLFYRFPSKHFASSWLCSRAAVHGSGSLTEPSCCLLGWHPAALPWERLFVTCYSRGGGRHGII